MIRQGIASPIVLLLGSLCYSTAKSNRANSAGRRCGVKSKAAIATAILATLVFPTGFARNGVAPLWDTGEVAPVLGEPVANTVNASGYRRVCSLTSIEHIGHTCEATGGACNSGGYACLTRFELLRKTYSCQLVDTYGNVYMSWTEVKETEERNGCCNICTLIRGSQVNHLKGQGANCPL